MVKYTTLILYIGLSDNNFKLYTIFEICEGKNHKHLKSTKPSNYVENLFFKD